METSFRFATADDLPAIVSIYNQAIRAGGKTADLNELTVSDRTSWFAEHNEAEYPIYVIEHAGLLIGWGSISPYRKGRAALRKTAEISYYLDDAYHNKGLGRQLIKFMLEDCKRLDIQNLFAILLDINHGSEQLLIKTGFTKWGHLPLVADINGHICGQLIYGINLP